jgi:hypothetical protein
MLFVADDIGKCTLWSSALSLWSTGDACTYFVPDLTCSVSIYLCLSGHLIPPLACIGVCVCVVT